MRFPVFVVCWNKNQCDWLKIETLEDHIKANLTAFANSGDNAMALLGLFDTYEQASEFCVKLREIRQL